MDWTQTLIAIAALWGAVLSTILAVLGILKHLTDRVNIKVTVRGNQKIHPITSLYGDMNLVSIKVVNKGRRPVTLNNASLLLPNGNYLLCTDSTTAKVVELTEGKSHTYLMDEDDLKEKYKLTPNKYIACVIDASEKHYWSCGILMRLLKVGRVK